MVYVGGAGRRIPPLPFVFMDSRTLLRTASILSLWLLMVTGVLVVLRATPEGLALSDDSIAYIAGARSMLDGKGYREAWLASNQPVTHFPPAFPFILTLPGWLGADPLNSARYINALLFGLNAGLLGVLAWRMTPSLTAGVVIAALFILNSELLQVHTAAMSEPLFISLSLFAIWMFDLYFERHTHWLWLLFCGTFVGMAYLTRYAGLALIATFIVALIILRDNWRKRFISIGIFLAAVLPWILAWTIRNRLVAENTTNRVLAWHPITSENLQIGVRVFSDFFIPIESWRREAIKQPGLVEGMIVLVLVAVLVWVSFKAWKYFSEPQLVAREEKLDAGSREIIPFTTGLYLFAYLASIVAAMTMFDAATKFRLRILSPVFVCLLILLVYLGIWLRNKNRGAVIVLTIVFLSFAFYKQFITVNELSKGGLGYTSFQWYDSKAMDYLRQLPENVKIYTNEPGAVYLYTGRGSYVLPDRFDTSTAQVRAGFEEGVMKMQSEINAGKAVLALFDGGDNVPQDVAVLIEGLHLAHKSAGDEIYTQP
ncbi:MAG TPA: phospholipid carrier-dependent glycosyltransferase [Anaerolineales bacterium]|nr:phospholipid carrier-dependent glycosyltransferase [Anaerolineales bacterium]